MSRHRLPVAADRSLSRLMDIMISCSEPVLKSFGNRYELRNELFNLWKQDVRRIVSLYNINHMRICTWNSQGNPYGKNNEEKLTILRQLYKKNDVLLIQECGGIADCIDLQDAHYWVNYQAGAFNNRCSTCIISKLGGNGEILDMTSTTGRSAIHVEIIGLHIYTLHAASGLGLPDVMKLFDKAQEPFIIGGDMNCTIREILKKHGVSEWTNYIFSGTHSRIKQLGQLIKPDRLTHPGSRNELDYFVASLSLRSSFTDIYPVMGGDHYPVFTAVGEYDANYTARIKESVLNLLKKKQIKESLPLRYFWQ